MGKLSSPRKVMDWKCRDKRLTLGQRTLIMGIINVTPDSFSDGGRFMDLDAALSHADTLLEEGADILDIGGVSTRPGSKPVPVQEELERVVPVIEGLVKRFNVPLSVDTTSYEVAQRSLDCGAVILNDVSGLRADVRLAELAATTGSGLVLMHSRGTPETMKSLAVYEDVVAEVTLELRTAADRCLECGMAYGQLVLDPGLGFAKTPAQNLILLRNLPALLSMDYPILIGPSRKSFIGEVTGKDVSHRMAGTAASVALAIAGGASIVRVHDVNEMKDVACVSDAILGAGSV